MNNTPNPQQLAEIKLSISEFGSAQKDVKLAELNARFLQQQCDAKIVEVRAALELDAAWLFDIATGAFVQKPVGPQQK